MTEICRTCLQEIHSNSLFYYLDVMDLKTKTITIRCKLVDFIPEMDLDVVPNAVICNKCFESLTIAHEFKNKCLETEGKIQSYIEQMGYVVTSVNLREIVRRSKESHSFLHSKSNINNVSCHELDRVKSKPSINHKDLQHESIADLQCDARTIFALPKIAQLLAATPNVSTSQQQNSASLMCDECNFQATDDLDLKIHHTNSHSDKQNFIHKCTKCIYTAPKRQALIIHMRKHTKDPQHSQPVEKFGFDRQKCDIKSSNTRLKFDLSKQCTVTKRTEQLKRKKPYKCKLCDYSSSHKTNLRNHLKLHNGKMTPNRYEQDVICKREPVFDDESGQINISNNNDCQSFNSEENRNRTSGQDMEDYETAVKNEMVT